MNEIVERLNEQLQKKFDEFILGTHLSQVVYVHKFAGYGEEVFYG